MRSTECLLMSLLNLSYLLHQVKKTLLNHLVNTVLKVYYIDGQRNNEIKRHWTN